METAVRSFFRQFVCLSEWKLWCDRELKASLHGNNNAMRERGGKGGKKWESAGARLLFRVGIFSYG